MVKIALIGTFDTKEQEYVYLRNALEKNGAELVYVDMSVMGDSKLSADYSADMVALAGGIDRGTLQKKNDRGYAQKVMADGASEIVKGLYETGLIHGIIAMGGGQGTSMLSRVYSILPIGFPKFILSPLASLPGKMSLFNGINDTITMNTIVDVSGLNSMMMASMDIAAACIIAAAKIYTKQIRQRKKQVVGISMFGITTKCVTEIECILSAQGYEVLVFHANGFGGKSLEKMVEDGIINAVIDITTSEVIQNLLGGRCDAGPHRMEAIVQKGIPYVVSLGAMDSVNFMDQDPIPQKYQGRQFHMHGVAVKLMRTNPEENSWAGKTVAQKLNVTENPSQIMVLLPMRGLSANDVEGSREFWPEADKALFGALRENLRRDIPIEEVNCHINDTAFARRAAEELMRLFPL